MTNPKSQIPNPKFKNFKFFTFHFSLLTSHRGFTLVELLIAIVITALAIAAVYSTFIVQQRSFSSQDQVAETQVSSKIAFDMIVNDIRNAGFGYPADENPTINNATGAITINNAGGPGSSDTITLIGGFRQIATSSAPAVVGQNQISISYLGSISFNLSNRRFLSIDGIDFAQITNCTIPQGSSDCSPGTLTLDRGINIAFPTGRAVYLVEDITYQIDDADNLQRNGDIIANNIEDLQFARIPATGTIDRIRVSLLARTANEDRTLDPLTKPYAGGIRLEDGNTIGAGDRFRRRVWSMEVALRNPR